MTNLMKILFTVLAISFSALSVQAQAQVQVQERATPRYVVRTLSGPVQGSNGLFHAELVETDTGKTFSALISREDIVPFAHYMAIRPNLTFWDI